MPSTDRNSTRHDHWNLQTIDDDDWWTSLILSLLFCSFVFGYSQFPSDLTFSSPWTIDWFFSHAQQEPLNRIFEKNIDEWQEKEEEEEHDDWRTTDAFLLFFDSTMFDEYCLTMREGRWKLSRWLRTIYLGWFFCSKSFFSSLFVFFIYWNQRSLLLLATWHSYFTHTLALCFYSCRFVSLWNKFKQRHRFSMQHIARTNLSSPFAQPILNVIGSSGNTTGSIYSK